jgi:glycosyltransferase involved in cell wall biosynthesis
MSTALRSVLYVQYTSPANYPPLEHSGTILQAAGWRVAYLGVQSVGAAGQLELPPGLASSCRLLGQPRPGWRQKVHYLAFILRSLWRARRQRVHWLYCSDLLSTPAALLAGVMTGARVLYHEHDSPESEGPSKAAQLAAPRSGLWGRVRFALRAAISGLSQRILAAFRGAVIRRADLVVMPNAARLVRSVHYWGRVKPSFVVFNCPRRQEIRERVDDGPKAGVTTCLFHGSINRSRLPLELLPARAALRGRVRLFIVGYTTTGAESYLQEFTAAAQRLGVGDAVRYWGPIHRYQLLEFAARCDVGLALMPLAGGDWNMRAMAGASNKPFEYLACGLALLVTDLPEWRAMYVEPGFGRACQPQDSQSLELQLRWFCDHPAERRAMGARGRERVLAEWNYETQFAPVLSALESSPVRLRR